LTQELRAREFKASRVKVVSKMLRFLRAIDGSFTGLRLREMSPKNEVIGGYAM